MKHQHLHGKTIWWRGNHCSQAKFGKSIRLTWEITVIRDNWSQSQAPTRTRHVSTQSVYSHALLIVNLELQKDTIENLGDIRSAIWPQSRVLQLQMLVWLMFSPLTAVNPPWLRSHTVSAASDQVLGSSGFNLDPTSFWVFGFLAKWGTSQ